MHRFNKEEQYEHDQNSKEDDVIVTAVPEQSVKTEISFEGNGMTGLSKLLSQDITNSNSQFHLTGGDMIIPTSVSGTTFAHHHRKGTESTMSSSPPVDIDESNSSHHHQLNNVAIHENTGRFFTSSSSFSPKSQSADNQQSTLLVNETKDMIAPSSTSTLPSPIGKQQQRLPNHPLLTSSHQSNSASPSLSLTPNSSDGSNFILPPGVTGSTFPLGGGTMSAPNSNNNYDGPSMPFLYNSSAAATTFRNNLDGNSSVTGSVIHHHQKVNHHRGDSSSFGSFDLSLGGAGNHPHGIHTSDDDDDDNDGLFGLDALHYRVATLATESTTSDIPALASSATSSPRIARRQTYHIPTELSTSSSAPGVQPRRSSTFSDRPPLSSQYAYGDNSITTLAGSYGSNSDRVPIGSANGFESPAGFGAIGQLRQNAVEFDPNRCRSNSDFNSASTATIGFDPQSIPQADISQKFGTLPTLSSHIHQQQQNFSESSGSMVDLSKPRHTRSISQPGPPGMSSGNGINAIGSASGALFPQDKARYYGSGSSSYDGRNNSPGISSRNTSTQRGYSHDMSFGNTKSNALSTPNLGHTQSSDAYNYSGFTSEYGYDNFTVGSESQSANGHFIGAYQSDNSYGRSGRQSSSSSPGPNQSQYYNGDGSSVNSNPNTYHHIRHQSDNGMMMNSSQSLPLGFNSGLPRHDDDFGQALAGEDIDVPDHDDTQGLPPYFLSNGSLVSHPLLRGATHSHSMSLDGMQAQNFVQPSAPNIVYAVKFKRSQRNFILGPRINRDLKIGTYVKVEADRGEDLGIVVGKLPPEKFGNTFSSRSSFTAGMGPSSIGSSTTDLKRIMRLATHDEVSLLGLKREEEEELLKICRTKVRQRGLPMNVIDAEYQFDRHKLTFFFEAMGRVDFRELVRDLFSMYKTRIWMQQLDKNTSTSAQAMIYPTANLQMDYGTPIIAPTSEFADSIMYSQGNSSMPVGGTDLNRSH
jgi:hypothetical protein